VLDASVSFSRTFLCVFFLSFFLFFFMVISVGWNVLKETIFFCCCLKKNENIMDEFERMGSYGEYFLKT
jgi:hypothetical protein